MSRYPVPIFQPTVPLGGNVPLDWLEKINHWMSLQYDKNEEFRRQLETQNHLLIQLNRRLDRVFLKLATLESENQSLPAGQPGSASHSMPIHEHRNSAQFSTGCDGQQEGEGPAAFESLGHADTNTPKVAVSSWQQQREAMLKCLVAQLEIEDSLYPADLNVDKRSSEVDNADSIRLASFPTNGVVPEIQQEQIETLKEQLHAAIREMEVECSVQRAKLSHERARLEAREADLERREKKLVRESREKKVEEERAEPLVSRIKGMLRRGG